MRVDRRHSRERKTISVLPMIVSERQQPDRLLAGILFETRVVAHRLDQVAAVRLNELDDIDPRQPQCHQHLDDQLVARRRRRVRRCR